MQYGYFDDATREYVVTRPDTPTPWFNYLGSGGFSSIISNNAGGLVFDGDPGKKRLTRYKYNQLPADRQGHFLYVRDMETGEYWSPTWQPVLKDLDSYECRHGLGYTVIKSSYQGIEVEITYFIPAGKKHEIWLGKITNKSSRSRNLKLFSYMEFSHPIVINDVNAEWARYFMTCKCDEGVITFDSSSERFTSTGLYPVFGTSLEVDGYDCWRDAFIGAYRGEHNPIAVERGYCSNSTINADHACASLSSTVMLEEGESKEFIYTIGVVADKNDSKALVKEATDFDSAREGLSHIKRDWANHLEFLQVKTPDPLINTFLNVWHQYQCKMTFNWSRFISYYERGTDRGWGFRDSMQDILGVVHAMPSEVKARIKTLLKIQRQDGNARSVYYPGSGESVGGGRSDDHIWSIFSVCTYIKETGDVAFLEEIVPYVDGGEGTVLDHLIRGLEFTREHLGEHGIPLFLKSDWNDTLSPIGQDGKAESTFVFFQTAHAIYELIQLFEYLGDSEHLKWAREYYEWCQDTYPRLWDGKWFIRAYTDKGEKYGTDEDEYNKIFLNPQSWAVLSRLPSLEQGNIAFDNVNKYLFCEFGCISHYPASSGFNRDEKTFCGIQSGIKENGGVFYHASTWAVIAQTLLGRNEDAFRLYHAALPIRRNEKSDRTLIEPYCYASAMLGPSHERYGAASNSWLTGTASWMFLAVTQYIFGFRPNYGGVTIDPAIPYDWSGFEMDRKYQGVDCHVKVGKLPTPNARAKALKVDGEMIEGNFVPLSMIEGKDKVEIEVIF
ncbi:MAG: glycosyl transferase [Clostridia bacterium]|nr:glycosyl transferase [Clostridia bacterium]